MDRSKRWTRRILPLAAGLALPLASAPASAGESAKQGSVRIQVRGDDGGRVDLEVSDAGLSGILALADFECEGEDDPKVRAMMQELDREGDGGVASATDEDGDRIVARRRDGQLRLETQGDDDERAEVTMPWPLAECLMLGREPEGGLGPALARGELRLELDARDGDGRIRLSIGDERR